MKVAITGSSSGIGVFLSLKLSSSGHEVIALGGRDSHVWKLGEEFPSQIEADALIHLAHDRTMTLEENILNSEKLAKSFKGFGIFLSSISAHSEAYSIYGKSKYQSEEFFTSKGGAVLRAGVVYGKDVGGIYPTLQNIVNSFFILAVPFSGQPRLFTTHIEDLSAEIEMVLISKTSGVYMAANAWPMSLLDMVSEINESHESHRRKRIILVNEKISTVGLLFIKFLRIKSPMFDSLKSLHKEASLEELSKLRAPQTRFRRYRGFEDNTMEALGGK